MKSIKSIKKFFPGFCVKSFPNNISIVITVVTPTTVFASPNDNLNIDTITRIAKNNIVFEIQNEENIDDVNKNDYFITVENIKLALVYCNPLRGLPTFKYNVWKNMNLTFNNN